MHSRPIPLLSSARWRSERRAMGTIKNADFLLVVENGTIVEQGTHDELMALNGYYKKLYENYTVGMTV